MMATDTQNLLQQEQVYQKALLALFGLGVFFVCLSSYTTRSFLDSRLPVPAPSAFAALAATQPTGSIGVTPPTGGSTGNFSGIGNDLPARLADNFAGGRANDSGIIGGSATNSGQNVASGVESGRTGTAPGNGGTNGANGGTPTATQASSTGGAPGFTSILPGGTAGGGGSIGTGTLPPVVVAVPEPDFWLMAIIGFAGIGGQIRRKRASALLQRQAVAAQG